MFVKNFDIRWSDLDANRHLANSAYANLLSETRMSFLRAHGFTQNEFAAQDFGPVIFSEEFYYVKEILPSETVHVTLELLANTPDYRFIKFAQCLFNEDKKLSLYAENLIGWMSLKSRKLIIPPPALIEMTINLAKADNYQELPADFTLKNPKIPFQKQFK